MSEEQDIFVGKPSVNELRAYFLNPRWNIMDLNESSSSGSSLDLNESFKQILESKMRAAKLNSETASKDNDLRGITINSDIQKLDDTTIMKDESWCQASEESFLNLEKNCENTIISMDNNSLCNNDDDTQTIINRFKNKIIKQTFVNNLIGQQKLDINATQINEIEEPSCFWEQTIVESPSVDQARLSIIDEGSITDGEKSSLIYNNTVLAANVRQSQEASESSTDHFSTADDTDHSDNKTQKSTYLDAFPIKTKRFFDSLDSRTYESSMCSTETCNTSKDETFATAANCAKSEIEEVANVITISDDEDEKQEATISEVGNKSEDSFANKRRQTLDDISSIAQDSPNCSFHLKNNLSDESLISLESSLVKDKSSVDTSMCNSPKLNDTIDEFDYIIQKGVKMLAEQKSVTPLQSKFLQANKTKDNFKSPISTGLNVQRGSPATPNTVIRKKSNCSPLVNRQLFSKKSPANSPKTTTNPKTPMFFKKPVAPSLTSRIPQAKSLLSKPSYYEHVVSPIGVYINNGIHTPLRQNERDESGIFKSKLMLRYNEKKINEEKKKSKENINRNVSPPALPRKVYIAAEHVHMIDKRTNSKLYGGEQMQKIIGPIGASKVIKHDCRINTGFYNEKPKELDDTFADLSLLSGDMSVQIMKNANKF